MYEISKIMKTNLVTVKADAPIYDAVRMMVENKITGLPVVDDEMNLVGLISEKDVLSLLAEDSDGKVADFMTSQVRSFDVNDDFIAVCEVLVNNHFRRVPILENGKLAGIVSRRDIIKFIIEPIGNT